MDMFTGKKIADLRKFNSLSQEALAEKLGVSRQAVSKWERGEASPDMDNFVALAGIFGVGVDDLLGDKKAHELFDFSQKNASQPQVAHTPATVDITEDEAVSQPFATDKNEVSPTEVSSVGEAEKTELKKSAASTENYEKKGSETDSISDRKKQKFAKSDKKTKSEKVSNRIKKHTEKLQNKKNRPHFKPRVKRIMNLVPVFLIVPIVYVLLGLKLKMWHPAWLMFFILPVYYFTSFAFNARDKKGFFLKLPLPFLLIGIYLCFGFIKSMWHPMWIIFLILPIYYWIVSHIKKD